MTYTLRIRFSDECPLIYSWYSVCHCRNQIEAFGNEKNFPFDVSDKKWKSLHLILNDGIFGAEDKFDDALVVPTANIKYSQNITQGHISK